MKPKVKEIKISIIANTISMLLRAFLGAILTIILIRYLGKEQYGILTAVLSFLALIEAFADLGIGASTSRLIAVDISANNNINCTIIAGSILRFISIAFVTLLLFFFSTIISKITFNNEIYSYYLKIVSFGFFFGSMQLFLSRLFQGLHFSSIRSIGVMLDILSYFISSYFFIIILNEGLYGSLTAYNISKVFSFVCLFIIFIFVGLKLLRKYNVSFVSISKQFKKIFYYSIPLSITTLSAVFYLQLPIILLSRYSDNISVGLYGLPIKIITILIIPSQSFIFAVSSSITHSFETSLLKFRELTGNIFMLSISFFFSLSVFVYFSSSAIINSINSSFTDSISIMRILSLLIFVNSFVIISGGILTFIGKAKIETISYLIALMLMVLFGPISIKYFNTKGIALVSLTAAIFNALLSTSYIIIKYKIKIFDVKYIIKSIFHFTLLILLYVLINRFIYSNYIKIIIQLIAFIAFFMIINFFNIKKFFNK